MSFKKPFNQVEGLFSSRREIDKKIEKIQKDCNHSSKSIKQIQERLDSTTMVVRWTCDTCSLIIGIPNNNELQNYLNQ
tara:strand:- start:88 stop:321 length:234 start_codon:yes stop_codon:yes gene_type:complete